ncbi:hypothetical protein F3Y22_tig00116939pilonHSYRG00167 [Hibiscus syriacus]|uniref:Uncharacterized protein n=1 Tax=Hibiscus syriacus TaxID=106335 RepID=A0A6A2WMI2_HIBSY|nr:hypothetical protein F3Y22_tig00116939pilonHSYRG00167 [Hibiscus syriacus]
MHSFVDTSFRQNTMPTICQSLMELCPCLWEEALLVVQYGIQMEFGCTQAIKILDDINAIRSHISLVRAIAGLRMCAWDLRFQWVPCCSNSVADRLAKFAPGSHLDLVQYASPPLGIMDLLAIDSIATSTAAATPALD